MTDNHDTTETDATQERDCCCDSFCECNKCCEKARQKIVRHIAHSFGIEADEADTAAVAVRLGNAGFRVQDIGTKEERDCAKREMEMVQRLKRERQQRIHGHVKTLLGRIVAEMPDGGIRVFIDDMELPDNCVMLEIKDGELIDTEDGWTAGLGPPPPPRDFRIPF